VSLLERGRINVKVDTLRQVARVLNVTLSTVLQGLD
jgi:transcriptional regulator with XRE-family HTH domain